MRNIIGAGFEGIVYPINPKRDSIIGIKTYKSVEDVPDKIDLAIITTPASTVPDLVESCGKNGIPGVLLISAGFAEIGEAGVVLLNKVQEVIKKYNIRLIGPNCLGFIKPSINLNASFANKSALDGNIAFISQSGALCTAVLDWSLKAKVGFSYFVSIGSMINVSFHDLIDFFGNDPKTSSIVIYMESLADAKSFLSAARNIGKTKPIIVLKAGRSSEGAQAAMSHTGTLAGNDSVFDAAFERVGVIRVDTIAELFDSARTFALQKKPANKRLAIVTNAGGPGVITTDKLIAENGKLAELSDESMEILNQNLSPNWSKGNPIDVIGDAKAIDYEYAVKVCLNDDNVDGILIIVTPQAMTNALDIAEKIVKIPGIEKKTILASFMGEEDVNLGIQVLKNHKIPTYRTPEEAVKAFMLMYNYSRNLELLQETPEGIPSEFKPNKEAAQNIIDEVYEDNRNVMTEYEAKKLLKHFQIDVIANNLATSEDEMMKMSDEIGYPLVMKIASPDILHKTDVGGVVLNISCKEEAIVAYHKILKSSKEKVPDANIKGVFIEKMAKKKYELILGCKKDPIFGPTIVFGMGGVAVEIFKDTAVGIPPLNMLLAKRLMEDTKIYKLLKGYRGMPGVDVEAIQFLLYKFSYLVMAFPEIEEVDINPFGVDEEGGFVLDAKIILSEKKKVNKKPYDHLVILPYPTEYIKDFTLKNGKQVILRPIKPEDEKLEKEFFDKLSEATQKFRFFKSIKNISHEELVRYTQIDYDREMALIAVLTENGKEEMLGVVRLIADKDKENAQFAIVVADEWQHQGLGSEFISYINYIAKKMGLKTVYGKILHENEVMINIVKKLNVKFELCDKLGCRVIFNMEEQN